MAGDKKSSEPPSYSASFAITHPSLIDDLPSQLVHTRASYIRATIENLIAPVVDGRLDRALTSTSIALILSPTLNRQSPGSDYNFEVFPSKIIGLASDDVFDAKIHLTSPLDSAAFWKQAGVVGELEQMSQERWSAAWLREYTKSDETDSPAKVANPEDVRLAAPHIPTTAEQRPTGFLSFLSSKQIGNRQTGTPVLESGEPDMPTRRVLVKAKFDELCFRAISDFGLYETVTRPAVVIKIKVIC